MKARRPALHTLVGAYVLDAVPDPDRAEFERHLLSCEQCREDVRGLREAAALLGAATAVKPRPDLRQPTLRAAAVTRQLPPVLHATSAAGLSWRGWLAGLAARRWLAGVAVAVAAVLAVTAVLLGVHMGAVQNRLTAQQQRDSAITMILGAHDAVALTAAVRTGGTATVVMSHQARALVFTANGLTRLPGSRRYGLWLAGPGGITPAGMLPDARHGMSGPMVVGKLGPRDQLELTIEPATGSRQPTSAPIVALPLST